MQEYLKAPIIMIIIIIKINIKISILIFVNTHKFANCVNIASLNFILFKIFKKILPIKVQGGIL